jgi:hypothetical protein
MATPSPVEDPQLWSFMWLGGEQLPCVCQITGSTGWDIDVKKSKGSDGAEVKDNGTVPAKLSAKLTFVPMFWKKIQEILERVSPSQIGGKRKPVEIKNAATDARGIHSVYITEIGLPEVDSKGMMTQSLSLLQWLPQPKKTKAGTGANAKTPKAAASFEPKPPYSVFTPLAAPPTLEKYESGHGTEEDQGFLDFMQNAV